MPFKRREPTTIEDERAALRAQHAALEDLKRQLNERVAAVRERELELHHALTEVSGRSPADAVGLVSPPHSSAPPRRPAPAADDPVAETGVDALEAQRREQALIEREQAVVAAEAALLARTRQSEQDPARERDQLAARELEADAETMVGVPVPVAVETEPEPTPESEADAERLARIEARVTELREAEKMFLRTRDELAARSEAVAARERLVAQKERELDDREDGVGQWASPELTEMEARLRRLEQQQDPSEQTMGFSGGLRKLQQGTARPQRDD